MSNQPGWYPDPTGQAAQRYYDGTAWTEHVADATGARSTAPLTPPTPPAGAAARPAATPPAQPAPQAAPPAQPAPQAAPQPAPYGAPPAAGGSGSGITPTVGLAAAVFGGLLVLLSVFSLDFLTGDGQGASLGDISDLPSEVVPALLDTYAGFGRLLGLLVVALAVVAVLKVVPQLNEIDQMPIIVAGLSGLFALWHVVAMFGGLDVAGLDTSPAFGAYLGALGWIGLGASPFLTQPIGNKDPSG